MNVQIFVTWHNGSTVEWASYRAESIAEALSAADSDIFARYYARPPANVLASMRATLKAGGRVDSWSWFTIELPCNFYAACERERYRDTFTGEIRSIHGGMLQACGCHHMKRSEALRCAEEQLARFMERYALA